MGDWAEERAKRIWQDDLDGCQCDGCLHSVESIATALREAECGKPQWRPMATAPKEKAVLIWVPENKCIYAAYWHDEAFEPHPGWRVFGGEWRSHLQRATHWMPLPEPPREDHSNG